MYIKIEKDRVSVSIEALKYVLKHQPQNLTHAQGCAIRNILDELAEWSPKKIFPKKTNAAKKATAQRSEKAKEKITNAVNLLRMQNIEVTTYLVSKESGCSFNTCKKYQEYWKKEKNNA